MAKKRRVDHAAEAVRRQQARERLGVPEPTIRPDDLPFSEAYERGYAQQKGISVLDARRLLIAEDSARASRHADARTRYRASRPVVPSRSPDEIAAAQFASARERIDRQRSLVQREHDRRRDLVGKLRAKGWKLDRIAAAAGVSRQAVSKWLGSS